MKTRIHLERTPRGARAVYSIPLADGRGAAVGECFVSHAEAAGEVGSVGELVGLSWRAVKSGLTTIAKSLDAAATGPLGAAAASLVPGGGAALESYKAAKVAVQSAASKLAAVKAVEEASAAAQGPLSSVVDRPAAIRLSNASRALKVLRADQRGEPGSAAPAEALRRATREGSTDRRVIDTLAVLRAIWTLP